jgi:hypothetical protein
VDVAPLQLEQVHLRPRQGQQARRGGRVQRLALGDGDLPGLIAHVVAGDPALEGLDRGRAALDCDGLHRALPTVASRWLSFVCGTALF